MSHLDLSGKKNEVSNPAQPSTFELSYHHPTVQVLDRSDLSQLGQRYLQILAAGGYIGC